MKNAGIEIERKYIISLPTASQMSEMDSYTQSAITQIYLRSEQGVTHRVRRRVYADRTVCTETKKIRIDKMSSIEDEHEISEPEFIELSKNIAEGSVALSKVRHTFVYRSQLFEIDVYPEWHSTCIMETELTEREKAVEFPPFISIVKEVTGIKAYSNASMSRCFPKEITSQD